MNRELNQYEKEFTKRGYTIDDSFPECEEHCSQMMLNKDGFLECVVCSGNEIAIVIVAETI